ncbi:helix-turn-helix domain-containing protein [Deinococcus roseus]|uniref:DNA-binding protein n=1 Tax=Deinococcus roseus TaxID=392414 RepID=A0ABQ2DBZ4_9DEIO|nr:XRE family transcriptional regulator [Deinococcus roseus]GGJ52678.1 DNA-binding protein [Deinococcus roseus]
MSTQLQERLQHIARNLKQARNQKGWSQQDLAAHSGISRRMIAAIEGAQNNVSLGTLDLLANALGVRFMDLITTRSTIDFSPQHPWQGVVVWHNTHPDSHAEMLASPPMPCTTELWHWSLAPGDHYQAAPDRTGVQEILYVIQGEIELEHNGQRIPLKQGDTLTFPSDVPYAYHNPSEGTARIIKHVVLPLLEPEV